MGYQLWGSHGPCPSSSLEDPQMRTQGHSQRLRLSVVEGLVLLAWAQHPLLAFRSPMRISAAASPRIWTVLISTPLWMTSWVRASLTPGLSTDLLPSLSSSTLWTLALLAIRLAATLQTLTLLSFSATTSASAPM